MTTTFPGSDPASTPVSFKPLMAATPTSASRTPITGQKRKCSRKKTGARTAIHKGLVEANTVAVAALVWAVPRAWSAWTPAHPITPRPAIFSASATGRRRTALGRRTSRKRAAARVSRAAASVNGPKLSSASLVAGNDPPHIKFSSTSPRSAHPGDGTVSSRARGLIWNRAQAAGAVVVERARELFVRVHHKGAIPGNWLADRQTAHDVHVERWRVAVLLRVGADANRVAAAEHR